MPKGLVKTEPATRTARELGHQFRRERRGRRSSPAELASSPRASRLATGRRGPLAPGCHGPSVPSPKGRSTSPAPQLLSPSRWAPPAQRLLPVSGARQSQRGSSPVSGIVLCPREGREGWRAPADTFPARHPSLQGSAPEVGAPGRAPSEPARSSPAGPHLEKRGGATGGGQDPTF